AGCPRPSYLTSRRPKWHELVCIYNPTSILWRYASITDRRIRALKWTPLEMASANALFWTSHGWDGTEEMALVSVQHCIYLPDKARASVWSLETLKSIIILLQGAQVLYDIAGGLTTWVMTPFTYGIGADIIFWPFSVIGLFRLCCALWLTEDYLFSPMGIAQFNEDRIIDKERAKRPSFDSLQDYPEGADLNEMRFHPVTNWYSRVFRAIYPLGILCLSVLAYMRVLLCGRDDKRCIFPVTSMMVVMFYGLWLTITAVVSAYYLWSGHSTTIIPCIGSAWYKAYTLLTMAFAAALLTVASVETTQTLCGSFTSSYYPYDRNFCGSPSMAMAPLDPRGGPEIHNFGIASRRLLDHNSTLGAQTFLVDNFTGLCVGHYDDQDLAMLATAWEMVNATALLE
ncbi:hypothetical protein F5Y15DRAFT_424332, partial [Xylariaceae sp. FL0016]